MIKNLSLFFFILFLFSCSLSDGGGFWSKEKTLKKENLKFKSLLKKEDKVLKEFNQNFKLTLDKSNFNKDKNYFINNNDGFTLFDGQLKKIRKYNFDKIKNFYNLEPNLIFFQNNIIFFDNKGSILSFDANSKLNWKINNYSRAERKDGPLLILKSSNDKLIVADNFSNYYAININNGNILWSKKIDAPFNSEIKIFNNKIFITDSSNTLNCFSLANGNLLWTHTTEKSFINSKKKLSIILNNQSVIFSNSLGEITSVNINNGSLLWQRSTENSKIYEDIMTLKTSDLILKENSIYFSNNKNKFYSIDAKTGTINWIQNINSNLKPTSIDKLILTVSIDGHFFILDRISGNILRITDLFNQLNVKQKMIYPTGFILNYEKLFVSLSNGRIIIAKIKTGKVIDIIKIDNEIISRPFVKNQNMYLIRDNSIIKLN